MSRRTDFAWNHASEETRVRLISPPGGRRVDCDGEEIDAAGGGYDVADAVVNVWLFKLIVTVEEGVVLVLGVVAVAEDLADGRLVDLSLIHI